MCFFHKWKWTHENWLEVVGITYRWKELAAYYQCEKCKKRKEVRSGIRRNYD